MQFWKVFLILAGFFGATAVGFGAFGAHGLKDILSVRMLEVYQTAVKYQMFHVSALLSLGILLKFLESKTLQAAGVFFSIGIIIFSGSLYTLSLTGIKWLGAITPIGGVFFIIGWMFLAWGVIKSPTKPQD